MSAARFAQHPESPTSPNTPARLLVPEHVAELIRRLHPDIKHKVRAALRAILSDPNAGKPLREELAGLRSFRLGQMRLVYRLSKASAVEIVALGPRHRIYEDTLRRVRGGT